MDALDAAEPGEESRVQIEPAIVNGQQRVVLWVEDEKDESIVHAIAALITDEDKIEAEGLEKM